MCAFRNGHEKRALYLSRTQHNEQHVMTSPRELFDQKMQQVQEATKELQAKRAQQYGKSPKRKRCSTTGLPWKTKGVALTEDELKRKREMRLAYKRLAYQRRKYKLAMLESQKQESEMP